MQRGLRGLMLAGVLAVSAIAGPASAEPSQADKAAARALFDDGRKLVQAGKFEDGCIKLAESNRIDPGAGVQFHLANCYERTGKLASAWQLFLEVASASQREKQADKEKVARQRAADLEPQLMRITILVPESAKLPGLVVKRDGTQAGEGMWGTAVPVDPGKHLIEASAPGKKAWSEQVEVARPGATVEVKVPTLEDDAGGGAATATTSASAAPTETAPPAQPSPPGRKQRIAGIVVGAIGLAGVGLGGYMAVAAKARYDEAKDFCNGNKCLQEGADIRNEGIAMANAATLVGAVGGVMLITGVIVFATARRAPDPSTPTTALVVGPGNFSLRGTW